MAACPDAETDPDACVRFLSDALRRRRRIVGSPAAWFQVHELLAGAFRAKEPSAAALKSALFHDEQALEGVAAAGRGPLDTHRSGVERRCAETCGLLAEALRRGGAGPTQRRGLVGKEVELAELAASHARDAPDEKVAIRRALEGLGAARLRETRLEAAAEDPPGTARLPKRASRALDDAIDALDGACKDFATADADALARLGASLETRAVAVRASDDDARGRSGEAPSTRDTLIRSAAAIDADSVGRPIAATPR